MSTSQPLPPKKDVALALLERSSVHVHLDPRGQGVMVPALFKRQPQLVLQIGLSMPVPIPDLRLDAEGLTCTLSFSRSPFHCVIPWSSVFAMVGDDGNGMVWPDDVPPEIATQAQTRKDQARKDEIAAKRPVPRRVPALAPESAAPGPRASGAEISAQGKSAAEAARAAEGAGAAESGGAAEAGAAPTDGKPAKARKPRTRKPRTAAVEPEPDLRPMLVAVPAPAEKRAAPRIEVAEKRRAPVERPPQRPSASPSKPKRELPPYLRVVK